MGKRFMSLIIPAFSGVYSWSSSDLAEMEKSVVLIRALEPKLAKAVEQAVEQVVRSGCWT